MDEMRVTENLTMLRVRGWQVYVWRDGDATTLIDTSSPGSGVEIAEAVVELDRIVLTHGHVDHCGSAAELHGLTGAMVCAGAGDVDAIRSGVAVPPPVLEEWERPIMDSVTVGLPSVPPAVTVHQELQDGDVLDFGGGAHIVAVPGHTSGSIAIYLPKHRVLFTGDTIANVDTVMLGVFNQDRTQTLLAARRLSELDAETVCFGHGDPLTDSGADRLRSAFGPHRTAI